MSGCKVILEKSVTVTQGKDYFKDKIFLFRILECKGVNGNEMNLFQDIMQMGFNWKSSEIIMKKDILVSAINLVNKRDKVCEARYNVDRLNKFKL